MSSLMRNKNVDNMLQLTGLMDNLGLILLIFRQNIANFKFTSCIFQKKSINLTFTTSIFKNAFFKKNPLI